MAIIFLRYSTNCQQVVESLVYTFIVHLVHKTESLSQCVYVCKREMTSFEIIQHNANWRTSI